MDNIVLLYILFELRIMIHLNYNLSQRLLFAISFQFRISIIDGYKGQFIIFFMNVFWQNVYCLNKKMFSSVYSKHLNTVRSKLFSLIL